MYEAYYSEDGLLLLLADRLFEHPKLDTHPAGIGEQKNNKCNISTQIRINSP